QGTFGSGYDCAPHAIVFDAAGTTAYVGQAGCTGAILKFAPGQSPIVFTVAPDTQGSFWIDFAVDACTIFYTFWGPNVKRFDGCAGVQLPDFNVAQRCNAGPPRASGWGRPRLERSGDCAPERVRRSRPDVRGGRARLLNWAGPGRRRHVLDGKL